MTEPIYVAQTFEPESLQDQMGWYKHHSLIAKQKGGVHPRFSWKYDDGRLCGLLIEVWDHHPENEGEQRWSMVEGKVTQ